MSRRRRAKASPFQDNVVPTRCRAKNDVVSTRFRAITTSCHGDTMLRRRPVNTTSSQHSAVPTCLFFCHDDVVSPRCRANTKPGQHDVGSKRCRLSSTSCQHGVVSRQRRVNTTPCQDDVVPRRHRVETTPCQDDVVSQQCRAKNYVL